MSAPRCSVRGCNRPADTLIEGDNKLTGERLPDAYSCDDPEHQYTIAMAILPSGEPLPGPDLASRIKATLAEWNADEASR